MNTLVGPAFKKYIDDKVKQTAKYVINKKSLSVKALPEFISVFNNSNNFSVEKGRTNHLIKSLGKWEEIEDSNKDKLNAANISIKILMSKINRLENKIIMYEDTQSVL